MTQDPRIEDYLDHVYAPLIGVVPYAKRQELRAELRAHLEALVASHQELGRSAEVAALEALRQFGDPRDLARQWAREWKGTTSPTRVQPAWRAMAVALGCFGFATVIALTVLWMSLTPYAHYDLGRIPLGFTLFLLPLVSGLSTGLLAPARHGLGTFYALAAIMAVLVVGVGSEPTQSGLGTCARELAMIQAYSWMPIGCGTAALVGWLQARLGLRPARWVLQ